MNRVRVRRPLDIVAGRYRAEDRRRMPGEPPAPLPEHRAAKVAAVHGTRAKLYEKRQQALNLSAAALELPTHIMHREPRQSSRRVEQLYALLEVHGDVATRAAIASAVSLDAKNVAGVRRVLRALEAQRQLALPACIPATPANRT